jgi:glycerol-3-phosphate dehydrogenase
MTLLAPLLTTRHQLALALHESQRKAEIYDLVVVGGGATGLGVALDAAARGLRVLLVSASGFVTVTFPSVSLLILALLVVGSGIR